MAPLRRKLLTAVVSLVLTLALAEWAVGHFLPFGVPLFRLDPELLHTTVPGAERVRILQRKGGRLLRVELDEHGYRLPGLGSKGEVPRLVVLGDSLVMAENVSRSETFVVRLAEEFEGAAQVVNAGVTGYGPDQSLLKLEAELELLDPDGVLFVLCAHNDHGDLIRNKLFRLDDQGQLVRRTPWLRPEQLEVFQRGEVEARAPALLRCLRVLRRPSPPAPPGATEVTGLYRALGRAELASFDADDGVGELFADYYDLDVAAGLPGSEGKEALLAAVLGRLAETCAEAGIPLFALVVPSPIGLVPDFEPGIDPVLAPSHQPARLTRSGKAALESAGIPNLDLTPGFQERPGPETLFEAGDFHWSAEGQALGASLGVAFLRAQGWPKRP